MALEASRNNITIRESWQDPLPRVAVSRRIFEVIFETILTNAVRYTLSGGEITVAASRGEGNNTLLISVSDTGIGIPQEEQPIVFTRPFQGRNGIKHGTYNGVSGYGLGLFIIKPLAQRIQGDIWFTSREGEGSTFFISLPLA